MNDPHPRSTARIAGHPIHPMLVPFPIAFFVGTLLSDLLYWQLRDPFWAEASFYLLGAAIVTALAAALAGFADFFGNRRIRALAPARQHMFGNLTAVVLALVNFGVRIGDPEAALMSVGLPLSILVGLILVFTGWRGGDLVFRHGVGVTANPAQE